MKIIVTGSEGFIGTNCLHYWGNRHQVITIDKEGTPNFKTDLYGEWPESHLFKNADALVHLASKSVVYVPPGEEKAMINHNVTLAERALNFCEDNEIPLMIHASSSAVYGDRCIPPYTESRTTYPMGAYGRSKEMSEMILEGAKDTPVKTISFRMFNAIGKWQKKSMLPWLIMEALRTGEPITLFGHTLRSWTAVEDIVSVFEEAIMHREGFHSGHQVYNLGLDLPISQVELFRMFEQHLRLPTPYTLGDRRPFEMYKTQPDLTAFRKRFAYQPKKENLEQAVRDVIAYHYVHHSGTQNGWLPTPAV